MSRATLLSVCLCGLLSTLPAVADPEKNRQPGSVSFFVLKEETCVPSFSENAANYWSLPDQSRTLPEFAQIKLIPSLSEPQQRRIARIYDAAKKELDDKTAQYRAVRRQLLNLQNAQPARRSPLRTADGRWAPALAAAAGPADKLNLELQQLQKLRAEVIAGRALLWQKVEAELSDRNREDLRMMREGMLLPPELAERQENIVEQPGQTAGAGRP